MTPREGERAVIKSGIYDYKMICLKWGDLQILSDDRNWSYWEEKIKKYKRNHSKWWNDIGFSEAFNKWYILLQTNAVTL